ncbi:hypothetical protein EMIHUDRAFT_354144 [Emiliania huxleyi CCMP1516]|uniref:Secreted protein n=2 Tax=Emiliania huxleyi TaxID=2903 RepID=A0A0D3JQR3_EMIH1|nr:hypothetical protein EMIHUDRAFT_354144 [Emiliania huxleyi CCMP1516]EOD25848.1 hypothetical protein EMIHUDRAFT_354144 [Emiliania huxleyi CCMP1516]|eukprot:XP_005778277.1 hypothetical protein EMIHUDRAFT_354144 [Emiliania huxleyi CCMP1516]
MGLTPLRRAMLLLLLLLLLLLPPPPPPLPPPLPLLLLLRRRRRRRLEPRRRGGQSPSSQGDLHTTMHARLDLPVGRNGESFLWRREKITALPSPLTVPSGYGAMDRKDS